MWLRLNDDESVDEERVLTVNLCGLWLLSLKT